MFAYWYTPKRPSEGFRGPLRAICGMDRLSCCEQGTKEDKKSRGSGDSNNRQYPGRRLTPTPPIFLCFTEIIVPVDATIVV